MTRQFLSAALHAMLAPLLLYGGIYVSFYLFIYYFNIPDGPLPLVLKILAGLGMPVLVLAGGGLWGGALALQRGEPVRPNFKKGLRTWGLTVIPGIILLDLTQIPAFILVRFLPFPHRFHYLFTLFFVPGIGLATWIMVRVMARALGMAASARAAGWSAFAAGGVFLAASLVLLFVYGWEVAGPLAGRQYNMLMIAHVCGFAAAAAAGAVFGWYLGAPAGASAADREVSWRVFSMSHTHNIYHSFMIRLWIELREGPALKSWQIELESIQTGQTHHFSEPEAVFDFLREQFRFDPKPDRDRN